MQSYRGLEVINAPEVRGMIMQLGQINKDSGSKHLSGYCASVITPLFILINTGSLPEGVHRVSLKLVEECFGFVNVGGGKTTIISHVNRD